MTCLCIYASACGIVSPVWVKLFFLVYLIQCKFTVPYSFIDDLRTVEQILLNIAKKTATQITKINQTKTLFIRLETTMLQANRSDQILCWGFLKIFNLCAFLTYTSLIFIYYQFYIILHTFKVHYFAYLKFCAVTT